MTTAVLATDSDGLLDTLRYSGSVDTPQAGTYVVSATLDGPDGTDIAEIQQGETLTAGENPIQVDLDGNLVGANGSGTYTLAGISIYKVSDSDVTAATDDATSPSPDASQWIGGTPTAATLRQLWETANRESPIFPHGLFVSEDNRLQRIEAAEGSGDVATETRELDTFIADVTNTSGVQAAWRQRVLDYATALRDTLIS